jgi:hypothetical protein
MKGMTILKERGIGMSTIRTILLGALMLIFLGACQQSNLDTSEPDIQEKEEIELDSDRLDEDRPVKGVTITAKEIESYPISLYDQTTFDLDGDGEQEQIEMYVNAEQAENGEYIWDDGQNWLLVVKDGDKTYPLFDGWVQIGKLSFWLLESDEKPMLILLKTGTAEFNLQTFTFNEEESGYLQEIHFNPENVNFWYGSK